MAEVADFKTEIQHGTEVACDGSKAVDKRNAESRIVLMTAMQLGMDVLRDLYDCGNLVTAVKEEEMNMKGVRALLASTLRNSIK